MTGVLIFRGAGHVVEFQSQLFLILFGSLMGIPAREALCRGLKFSPLLKILDDVFATGIDMMVRTRFGVLWCVRLQDESGVAWHYDREPSLPLPGRREEPPLLVPVG